MSAMFDTALTSVPATKPACTAIVSHGACAGRDVELGDQERRHRRGREPQRHAEELRQRDDTRASSHACEVPGCNPCLSRALT